MDGPAVLSMPPLTSSQKSAQSPQPQSHPKQNQVTQRHENASLEINGLKFYKMIQI